jgi:hypothetical protein
MTNGNVFLTRNAVPLRENRTRLYRSSSSSISHETGKTYPSHNLKK